MTVAVKPRRKDYLEDGVTVAFAVPWRFNEAEDVRALRTAVDGTQTELVYGVNYAVTGGETDDGGELTLGVAGVAGGTLSIWTETSRGQSANYPTSGTFPAETHEARLDQLSMVCQEQDAEIERTVRVPRGTVPLDLDPFGLTDGDLLEYRDGGLRKFDTSGFAGQFYAGGVGGRMVPAAGTGNDPALRVDLANPAVGPKIVALPDGSPLDGLFKGAAIDVYVSEAGNDLTGTGTVGSPFKSIQRAYDSLPRILVNQATIWLVSGTLVDPAIFNENYLEGTADKVLLPRPAVLFCRGRALLSRSDQYGPLLTGPIVIKPTGAKGTAIIETTADLTYGVYVEACQVAMQNVIVRAGAPATGLAISHRGGAYLHTYDCDYLKNGHAVGYCVAAESGGYAEITGTESVIDGTGDAANSLVSVFAGSTIDLAVGPKLRNAPIGASVSEGGTLLMQANGSNATIIESTCTVGLTGSLATIALIGVDESPGGAPGTAIRRVIIDAPISLENCALRATYSWLKGLITTKGGSAFLDASAWQRQWTYYNTAIHLRGSKSYVTPAIASTDSQPWRCIAGLPPTLEGMAAGDIAGNAGGVPQFAFGALTFNGAGSAGLVDQTSDLFTVDGNGADRINCYLIGTNAWQNRRVTLVGIGFGVQFVDGADMEIPSGGVWVGNGQGHRRTAEFVFHNGKWHLIDNATAIGVADVAAMTYAAPAGGATIDAQARASLAQLALDVAAMRNTVNAMLLSERNAGVRYI